jgi:dTDP-4-amino-4,6-dideoxygalactose transaminase
MPTAIPFFRHDLGQPEVKAFEAALKDPILTTGATTAAFEKRFAGYLGVNHALGVTSCTGAMHMALIGLGVGPGDEVITTPMTFIATATAILEAGAKPVFVDVEPDTGNIDASLIEGAITPRTKAILPVHLYGLMVDMKAIREIADRHGLFVIEDAAHCIEGQRDGIQPGHLSDAACFSFYATKNMTCGEGGALVVNNPELYEKLKLIRLHGMTKTAFDRAQEGYTHWDMVMMGWKYNLSNLDASLLMPQLERLDSNLEKRAERASLYHQLLSPMKNIVMQAERPDSVNARHVFNIWVKGIPRDTVIQELRNRQIESVVNYRAIHLHQYLKEAGGYAQGDLPIAEHLGESTLSLPFYPNMPLDHVHAVCQALKTIVGA